MKIIGLEEHFVTADMLDAWRAVRATWLARGAERLLPLPRREWDTSSHVASLTG